MTTGTTPPGRPGPAAPVPRDTEALDAELDRLRRDLDSVSRQSENLQAALESNRRIGMAIGILMVTLRLTDEAAFECLRQASHRRNVKLRVVAEEVIYEGALD
jgi:AmiR/NasT family two-component response regulator